MGLAQGPRATGTLAVYARTIEPSIRPAISKRARIEARLFRARGVSDGGLDTAAAMQLTRVEE